jgi:hypothetical protein
MKNYLVFSARSRGSSCLQNVQTGSGPTQASSQRVTGAVDVGYSDLRVKMTTHLQLVSRIRMHGAMFSIPIHVPLSRKDRDFCLVQNRKPVQRVF